MPFSGSVLPYPLTGNCARRLVISPVLRAARGWDFAIVRTLKRLWAIQIGEKAGGIAYKTVGKAVTRFEKMIREDKATA